MALSDRMEIGSITILADGTLEIRADRVISDGTEELARKYSRFVATPDMDPSSLPPRVRKAVAAFWDAQTIADYRAKKAAMQAGLAAFDGVKS